MPIQLKEDDYQLLQTHLAELEQIERDITVAREIGVPGIEHLQQRCQDAKGKCFIIKQSCFPNRK